MELHPAVTHNPQLIVCLAPENTKDTARERSVGGMIRDRMSMAADGAMASPTPTAARDRQRPVRM